MNQLQRRVKRIEAATNAESVEVLHWIAKGLYYDDLSDEQRSQYCNYHGIGREGVEAVRLMISGNDCQAAFHFPLEKKQPPMTREEERQHLKRTAAEIEQDLIGAADS